MRLSLENNNNNNKIIIIINEADSIGSSAPSVLGP